MKLRPPTPPRRVGDRPATSAVDDPADIAVLFDRHAVDVRAYLARRVGPGLAEDLLAQTFLTAIENRPALLAADAQARPWLFGVATNLVRRHRRDEVRQLRATARLAPPVADHHDAGDAVASALDAAVSVRGIAATLRGMSRGDRDALLLHAWAELSYAEIAQALDVPVGTVRSRLHRARAQLRPLLEHADSPSDTTPKDER